MGRRPVVPPHLLALIAALAAAACGRQAIELGSSAEGAWTTADSLAEGALVDRWALELEEGVLVLLTLAATDSSPVELGVLGPGGAEVAWVDATGTASLIYRARHSGRHALVAVSPSGAAADRPYRLAAESLDRRYGPPDIAVAIAVGQQVEGVLEADDDGGDRTRNGRSGRFRTDHFAFQADSGRVVTITARSADFDALLVVEYGYHTAAFDDDGAGGTDATLAVSVPSNDSVRFAVTSFGRRPRFGRYTVTLNAGGEHPVRIADEPVDFEYPSVPLPEHRVCEGKPMPEAAPFDGAARGRRRTEVVEVGHIRRLQTPDDWRPRRARDVELVLCLTPVPEVVQTCYYMGPNIDRIRHRWVGRLVEARTARLVVEAAIEGDMPRACQSREPLLMVRIDGSLVSAHDAALAVPATIGQYVDPAALTSARP